MHLYDRYISAGRLENDISLEKMTNDLKRTVMDLCTKSINGILVLDYDGTMVEFKYAKDSLLPCLDDEIDKYAAAGNNLYKDPMIITAIQYVINEYIMAHPNGPGPYILSKSFKEVMPFKKEAINKQFPEIKDENIIQVESTDDKNAVLENLYNQYKKQIVFVEDTAKNGLNAEEKFDFVTAYHISSLLSERPSKEEWQEYQEKENSPYNLTIEEGALKIPASKFENDQFIKNVKLPNSLIKIGKNAFALSSIESLHLPKNLIETGVAAFNGCMKITKLTLEEGIQKISDFSFAGCSSLEHIKLPSTITEIGRGAFSLCIGLKSIELGNNIKKINQDAFAKCTSLSEIIFNGTKDELKNIEGIENLLKCNPKIKLTFIKQKTLDENIKSNTFKNFVDSLFSQEAPTR